MKKFICLSVVVLGTIFLGTYGFVKSNYYLIDREAEVGSVSSIAVQKSNPAICGKILMIGPHITGPSQTDLVDQCYSQVAAQLKNPGICSNIILSANHKEGCLLGVAVSAKNIDICQQISESSLTRGSCYSAFLQKNPQQDICENVGDNVGRDICYTNKAINEQKVLICGTKIKSEHYIGQCYKGIAMETRDISLCGEILDVTEKADCERYVNITK